MPCCWPSHPLLQVAVTGTEGRRPLLIITKSQGCLSRSWNWLYKNSCREGFFLSQCSRGGGVQYPCRVRIIFPRTVKYFLNLFPAQLLHRAFLLHLRAACVSVWEEVDSSKAWCSGPFQEVQAFTSKALILFFAELAQPLPVFGCA